MNSPLSPESPLEARLQRRVASLESEMAEKELALDTAVRRAQFEKDELTKQLDSAATQRRVLAEGAKTARDNYQAELKLREREILHLKEVLASKEAGSRSSSPMPLGASASAATAALQEELAELRALLDQREQEYLHDINELRIELEFQESSKAKEQQQFLQVSERGAQMAQRCVQLEEELAALRRELEQARGQLSKSRSLKSPLLSSPSKREEAATVASARRDLRNSLRETQGLEQMVEEQANQLVELEKQLRESRAIQAARTADRKRLEQEVLVLKERLEDAEEAAENLNFQERAKLEQRLADAQESHRRVAAELQKAETTLIDQQRKHERDTQSLRQKNESMGSFIGRLEERLRLAQVSEQTAMETLNKHRAQVESSKQRLEALLAEYAAVKDELQKATSANESLSQQMRVALKRLELQRREMDDILRARDALVPAPTGHVTLCFTDVEGSTLQWEWDAETMAKALKQHNELMRKKVDEYKGYEVKTEGDAFMVAFSDPVTAVKWCMDVQKALLEVDWAPKLLTHPKSQPRTTEAGQTLFRGLRVRMGIHCGEPSAEEDPTTNRIDYFGQMVNRAARVESVATGGQVVMTLDVHERVAQSLKDEVAIIDLGDFQLKGLNDSTHVFQVLPNELADRTFEASAASTAEDEKSLRKQLLALQEQNESLKESLRHIGADVEQSMSQAKHLLSDISDANVDGAPPEDVLREMRQQLTSLLASQEVTARELERTQHENTTLLQKTVEVQEQESLAMHKEKANLKAQIETLERKQKTAMAVVPLKAEGGMGTWAKLLIALLLLRMFVAPLIAVSPF